MKGGTVVTQDLLQYLNQKLHLSQYPKPQRLQRWCPLYITGLSAGPSLRHSDTSGHATLKHITCCGAAGVNKCADSSIKAQHIQLYITQSWTLTTLFIFCICYTYTCTVQPSSSSLYRIYLHKHTIVLAQTWNSPMMCFIDWPQFPTPHDNNYRSKYRVSWKIWMRMAIKSRTQSKLVIRVSTGLCYQLGGVVAPRRPQHYRRILGMCHNAWFISTWMEPRALCC